MFQNQFLSILSIIVSVSFLFSNQNISDLKVLHDYRLSTLSQDRGCPDGFYEDECGNCWMAYCYDFISHEIFYDIGQEDCHGQTSMWVIPGSDEDPYFNNYCESCPDSYLADDCGHCWQPFCYSFFQNGINGDGPHSVYYDLSEEECNSYGYGYYSPDHQSNPYWNSNCEEEFVDCNGDIDGSAVEDCAGVCDGSALVDDCGECQSAYCYDFVSHTVNFDFPCDGQTEMMVMPDDASNPYWNSSCTQDCNGDWDGDAVANPGDVNSDGNLNVIDVLEIVNHILDYVLLSNCGVVSADVDQDGNINVLDIIEIVEMILGSKNIGSATSVEFINSNNELTFNANGSVAAIELTIEHDLDFNMKVSNNALVSSFNTIGNITKLIVVVPSDNFLLRSDYDFKVVEAVAANSSGYLNTLVKNMPTNISVKSAYPNPFNPRTKFDISLLENSQVEVQVFNVTGQLNTTIFNGFLNAGDHQMNWDASQYPSGIYIIRTTIGTKVFDQRVSLIK